MQSIRQYFHTHTNCNMAKSGSTTVSSLLDKYQLQEEDCTKKVTNLHLDEISRSHCHKWRYLPARLEMDAIMVDYIDCGYLQKEIKTSLQEAEEIKTVFLSKWRDLALLTKSLSVLSLCGRCGECLQAAQESHIYLHHD